LFILAIDKKKAGRAALIYLGISMFCGLFSVVYEHFSYGVYSNYMIYLFLFPLLGGVLPFGSIRLLDNLKFPGRLALNLYNSGIAALTVGSCLQGALAIYGTTSGYMLVYWLGGILLVAVGVIDYIYRQLWQVRSRAYPN